MKKRHTGLVYPDHRLRIPSSLYNKLGLSTGDTVIFELRQGALVVMKAKVTPELAN